MLLQVTCRCGLCDTFLCDNFVEILVLLAFGLLIFMVKIFHRNLANFVAFATFGHQQGRIMTTRKNIWPGQYEHSNIVPDVRIFHLLLSLLESF